jgi:hypothetical protein
MGGLVSRGGRAEVTLARYAEYQGNTNNCGEYAVAAALSLLEDKPHWLTAQEVVDLSNSWTLVDSLRVMGLAGLFGGKALRMWKGGPTTSWQVANLARRLAKKHGLSVQAEVRHGHVGMRDELVCWLDRRDTVVVVTVAWDDQTHASIEDPNGNKLSLLASPTWKIAELRLDYAAHIMVLAAHDAARSAWGFINSWVDGATTDRLFWMTEEDFEETWGYARSPLFIPHMWVTISR